MLILITAKEPHITALPMKSLRQLSQRSLSSNSLYLPLFFFVYNVTLSSIGGKNFTAEVIKADAGKLVWRYFISDNKKQSRRRSYSHFSQEKKKQIQAILLSLKVTAALVYKEILGVVQWSKQKKMLSKMFKHFFSIQLKKNVVKRAKMHHKNITKNIITP